MLRLYAILTIALNVHRGTWKMGLKLSIHANGGYDVVATGEEGEECETREFVGFALTPWELASVEKKFAEQGAIITDFRSPKKLELARRANAAVEAARDLVYLAETMPGVEPEAIAKAKKYANECLRLATEESC